MPVLLVITPATVGKLFSVLAENVSAEKRGSFRQIISNNMEGRPTFPSSLPHIASPNYDCFIALPIISVGGHSLLSPGRLLDGIHVNR